MKLADLTERYSFCDPAAGKSRLSRTGARSAVVTVAVDGLGRFFVLEAWAERCPTERLIDHIFLTQTRWQARRVGIEANAMQSVFADTLVLEARRRRLTVPFLPVRPPSGQDKLFRIRSILHPLWATGRILLQPHQYELRVELTGFPSAATMDLVDAMAYAVALAPPRRIPEQHSAERATLAAYLRRAGVPPLRIEARMRDFDERQRRPPSFSHARPVA